MIFNAEARVHGQLTQSVILAAFIACSKPFKDFMGKVNWNNAHDLFWTVCLMVAKQLLKYGLVESNTVTWIIA